MSVFHLERFWSMVLVLGALSLCLSACDSPSAPDAPTLTPIADHVATPTGAPTGAPTPTPVAPRPITLTMWLPVSLGSGPAYDLLLEQLAAFAASEDGRPVEVLLKNDTGPGGLFDLLKTASPIASGILPDLIALNATDLQTAARSGLLQPIGAQLPADIATDLYPFASAIGSAGGDQLYGLVFAADLPHLVYNTRLVNSPPITWSNIITRGQHYVFPLFDVERSVSDDVLAQYLALGGRLLDDDGQPMLDEAALSAHLRWLQAAQQQGALPDNVLALDDPAEAWDVFLSGEAAYGNVRATLYLNTAILPTIQFAAVPGPDRPVPPIGRGWSLALVAHDARRQTAALRLMQWLIRPDNNGAWTQAARVLPGRAASLAAWDQTRPYTGFVQTQLNAAIARPPAAAIKIIGPAYAKAIQDTLTGRATPEEAAQAAVASLGQSTP